MGSGVSIAPQNNKILPQKLDWIRNLPCFEHLEERQLTKVMLNVTQLEYKKDEVIVQQGQPGKLFGIVISGSIDVVAIGPNGSSIVLCTQQSGFFFGEAAIIGNTTTTASIIAKSGVSILALTSQALQQLSEASPEVRDSLLHTVR